MVLLVTVAALIHRSRASKRSTGNVSPVGAEGVAVTELAPSGSVLVAGILWPGFSGNGDRIAPGARVSVVGGRLTELGLRVLRKS